MLDFINTNDQMVPVTNFLDTREKVEAARQSLEEATREPFEKLARAKVASWQESHEIVLD